MDVSDLYLSIIMTHVNYPDCFGGNTAILRNIKRNHMDPAVVAHALAEFMCNPLKRYLYVTGSADSHAELFYNDLKNILQREYEVGFCEHLPLIFNMLTHKVIVRIHSTIRGFPTFPQEHVALEFNNYNIDTYEHFDREDFAAFVYCGNSDNGPISEFRCLRGDGLICNRHASFYSCGVCFVKTNHRLAPVNEFYFEDLESVDDGIVCEPLGIPHGVFDAEFDDTPEIVVPMDYL